MQLNPRNFRSSDQTLHTAQFPMVGLSSYPPPGLYPPCKHKTEPKAQGLGCATSPTLSIQPSNTFSHLFSLSWLICCLIYSVPSLCQCLPCHGLYCPWLQGSAGGTETPWGVFVADPCQPVSFQPPSCLLLQSVLREPHTSSSVPAASHSQLLFTAATHSQTCNPLVKSECWVKLSHGLDQANTSLLLLFSKISPVFLCIC